MVTWELSGHLVHSTAVRLDAYCPCHYHHQKKKESSHPNIQRFTYNWIDRQIRGGSTHSGIKISTCRVHMLDVKKKREHAYHILHFFELSFATTRNQKKNWIIGKSKRNNASRGTFTL